MVDLYSDENVTKRIKTEFPEGNNYTLSRRTRYSETDYTSLYFGIYKWDCPWFEDHKELTSPSAFLVEVQQSRWALDVRLGPVDRPSTGRAGRGLLHRTDGLHRDCTCAHHRHIDLRQRVGVRGRGDGGQAPPHGQPLHRIAGHGRSPCLLPRHALRHVQRPPRQVDLHPPLLQRVDVVRHHVQHGVHSELVLDKRGPIHPYQDAV